MNTKIPLNGTGRLGRLAMMAPAYLCQNNNQCRILSRMIDEEQELRKLGAAVHKNDLERNIQTYALTHSPDYMYMSKLPDSACCEVRINGELPKERYHDRTFPKDYAKKKKAKRRAQKQARRKR